MKNSSYSKFKWFMMICLTFLAVQTGLCEGGNIKLSAVPVESGYLVYIESQNSGEKCVQKLDFAWNLRVEVQKNGAFSVSTDSAGHAMTSPRTTVLGENEISGVVIERELVAILGELSSGNIFRFRYRPVEWPSKNGCLLVTGEYFSKNFIY